LSGCCAGRIIDHDRIRGAALDKEDGKVSRTTRIVLCTALAAVAFPTSAQAHSETVLDRNDRPGPLDIRSASVGHTGNKIRHTITTFARWRTSVISDRHSPLNYVAVGLDLSGDSRFERFVFFLERNGRLRAFFINRRGRILRRLPASRPNGRSVSTLLPRDLVDSSGGYYWAAVSDFHRGGRHLTDWVPNRLNALHDLMPPQITLGSPLHDISTFASATTTSPIAFTLNDPGRSAGLQWRLQRRLLGSTTWVTADSGNGEGAQTADFPGEEGGNYFLRIVARDGHGNTRTSFAWRFSVPLDDANALFASSYSGTWTTAASGDPFLGTLHSTSTAGSSFTYTFTVTHPDTRLVWIGPGSPDGGGQATMTLDGGVPVVVDQSGAAGDRTIVWEGSDPPLGTHTIVISNVAGTIAIDGFLIR
jgi:hypothetical protein